MVKSAKTDLKFIIDPAVAYRGKGIPPGLTEIIERLEAKPKICRVAPPIFESGRLYALRKSEDVKDTARLKDDIAVSYAIGYFNTRPMLENGKCWTTRRFEPQLLLSHYRVRGMDFVFISLLNLRIDGRQIGYINRELKDSAHYSLIEIDQEDARKIYMEGRKQNFLGWANSSSWVRPEGNKD